MRTAHLSRVSGHCIPVHGQYSGSTGKIENRLTISAGGQADQNVAGQPGESCRHAGYWSIPDMSTRTIHPEHSFCISAVDMAVRDRDFPSYECDYFLPATRRRGIADDREAAGPQSGGDHGRICPSGAEVCGPDCGQHCGRDSEGDRPVANRV